MKKEILFLLMFLIVLYETSICTMTSIGISSSSSYTTLAPSESITASSDLLLLDDSSGQKIKKIFFQANKEYIKQNMTNALALYTKFTDLALSQKYEEQLWEEIRTSFSYMSSIFSSYSNYGKAIYYLKCALETTLKFDHNDYDNTFYFLFNIAENYYDKYDYSNSLEYYHQAEALYCSDNKLAILNKGHIYNNLALCYFNLGKDNESYNYLKESITIKKSIGDFANIARNYNNIGLIFQNKKQFTEALSNFTQSLFIYDSLNNKEGSALVINNIGNIFLEKGSLDSCKLFYKKSLDIRQKIVPTNYVGLVQSYNNLSIIHLKLFDLDSAFLYNKLAIDLNNQKPDKDSLINPISISDYLISISDRIELNLMKFKTTKNDKYLLESFEIFLPTVRTIINHLITYNSIISSNIFVNNNKRFFDLSLISSHLLDSTNQISCPRSLLVSETYKSLSILNPSSEIRNLQYDSVSLIRFGQLTNYYQLQQSLLESSKILSKNKTINIIDSLINTSIKTDQCEDRFMAILKNGMNKYFDNLSDSILAKCPKLEDKLIIDYYTNDNSIYIHTLTRNGISCIVHQMDKVFYETIRYYSTAVLSLDLDATISQGKILSFNLIQPIADSLKLHNDICIIPDESLSEIPFESLQLPEDNYQPKKYLVESKAVSYRFSIQNRNYLNVMRNRIYSRDFFGIAPFEQNESSFHNLSGSAREISDITNFFSLRGLKAYSLAGRNATFYNFTTSENFDSKILHFSTHSFKNNKSSQMSFLELFPGNDQPNLYLNVLSSIPFHNDLLLLNACETGSNLMEPSTGFVSFIRSLSNISVQNFICTLWKIYDESSYSFAVSFYNYYLNGFNYKTALTLAKRDFLKSNTYNCPIFWSPFILYENN